MSTKPDALCAPSGADIYAPAATAGASTPSTVDANGTSLPKRASRLRHGSPAAATTTVAETAATEAESEAARSKAVRVAKAAKAATETEAAAAQA